MYDPILPTSARLAAGSLQGRSANRPYGLPGTQPYPWGEGFPHAGLAPRKLVPG